MGPKTRFGCEGRDNGIGKEGSTSTLLIVILTFIDPLADEVHDENNCCSDKDKQSEGNDPKHQFSLLFAGLSLTFF
jgi:hypothetical protein